MYNNRNDTKTDICLRDVEVGEACVCLWHMQTCTE